MHIKKLVPLMCFILIGMFLVIPGIVNAEANLSLNVDVKQKLTPDIVSNGVYGKALTSNNTIFIPDKQATKLTAVSIETQSIQWIYNTGETSEVREMVLANDLIIMSTPTKIYAVNSLTGTLQWSADYTGRFFVNDGVTLYFVSGRNVVALDIATGNQKWTFAVSAREVLHSSIAIGEGKIYFTTDNQGDMVRTMYALDAESSQVMWATTTVDYYSKKPIYRDGKIYLNHYKEMYAYSAQTGAVLWKFEVAPNFTFEISDDTIYTRTAGGYLSAYDKETKALRWKKSYADSLDGGRTVNTSNGQMILTPQYIIIENNGKLKWYETANGNLVRELVVPGVKIQPVTAEDQVLLARDTTVSSSLYVFTPASDSVKPNIYLDTVFKRFSPYEGYMFSKIKFSLTEDAYVTVYVKDESGKVVRVINSRILNKGWNEVRWDGKTNDGEFASYGSYSFVFHVKDLAGNEIWREDPAKKTVLGDVYGTTIQETGLKKADDINSEILVTIPKDKLVSISGETADWYQISVELNGKFNSGYVKKSELSTRSSQSQPSTSTVHTVQAGDTLWKIAVKYNVTVQAIIDANTLDPTKYLNVGQKLTIPIQQQSTVVHTVQAGDTLWKVATQYKVTIQEIIEANKLDPDKYLYVGQKLTIPVKEIQPPTQAVIHTVQAGDALWKIAIQYNTTTQKIIDANNLDPSKYLYIGQKLTIPKN